MKRMKQIGAVLAILVLIGFGLGAMIFAFIDTPFAHKALTVCLYCAITVPVLIYAMMLVAKVLSGKGSEDASETRQNQPDTKEQGKGETTRKKDQT